MMLQKRYAPLEISACIQCRQHALVLHLSLLAMGAKQNISPGQAEYLLLKCFLDKALYLHGLAYQSTNQQHGFCLAGIGQEAIIPYLHETVRQDMKQEAANKLHGGKAHFFACVAVLPILIGERRCAVVN